MNQNNNMEGPETIKMPDTVRIEQFTTESEKVSPISFIKPEGREKILRVLTEDTKKPLKLTGNEDEDRLLREQSVRTKLNQIDFVESQPFTKTEPKTINPNTGPEEEDSSKGETGNRFTENGFPKTIFVPRKEDSK